MSTTKTDEDLQGNLKPETGNLKQPRPKQALPSGPLNGKGTLLIGIGNNSRADDGLGWAFLDAVDGWPDFDGAIEYRYQLQVEDAALIAQYAIIIIIDASLDKLPDGFQWKPCRPAPAFEFSTHALAPDSVLSLCQELYGVSPRAYTLALEGAEWGLQEKLSAVGSANLQAALNCFRKLVAGKASSGNH